MYHAALRVRPNYNEALNDLVHALQVPPLPNIKTAFPYQLQRASQPH